MAIDGTIPPAPVRVQVVHTFTSAPEVVFDKLVQHESYELFGLKVTEVRDGETGRYGVGSARGLKVGLLPEFWEATMTADRPTLIEYKIIKGSPLKQHWGRQERTHLPDGRTQLNYTIRFDMAIPGAAAITAKALTRAIVKGLPQLCP
jgi:hypothetical protein